MPDPIDRLKAALADRYRLEREVGAGGMATVYLAEDLKHQRKVALKVLRPDLAATLGPDRFIREIAVAANLQHPHILPLYDSGQADGFLFYVMPYVDGQSLRQRLVREGELPIPEAVRLLRDVADGMAYAHQQGVIHRDIKPENVMISGRHALVTDFGVAKAVSEATGRQSLTTAGVALGTPTYMAPEQAAADPHADHRIDIYALGVMAYELLTGRPPFAGSTPQAVLAAHVTTAAEPVTNHRGSIPPALAALVMRCLEKKPADRWQSAEEVMTQLEALLTPSGGVTPTATRPIAALAAKQRPGRRIAIAGFAVVALGAVAVFLWRGRPSTSGVAGAEERTVAVLYFDNQSRDTADAYLADGLTEDLAGSLSRVDKLQVKTPSAVRRAQTASAGNLPAIADALGVRYLVEGSVRRTPQGLRVTATLTDRQGEVVVWTERFDRSAEGLVDLPAEIARGVATGLAGKLSGAEAAAVGLRPTRNAQAYDLFLRANAHHSRRTRADVGHALDLYRQASGLDPSFVAARARIASCLAQMSVYGWLPAGTTLKQITQQGLAIADSAIAQDSLSVEAWSARAYLLMESDPVAGRTAAERAVASGPRDLEARNRLGWASWTLGDYKGAETEARAALRLDPGFQIAFRLLARIRFTTGRFAEALVYSDSAVAAAPGSGPALEERARAQLALGDTANALRDAIAAGTSDAANQWVELLVRAARRESVSVAAVEAVRPVIYPSNWLEIQVARGDGPSIRSALREVTTAGRFEDLVELETAPELKSIRETPEFRRTVVELRRRLKLP